MIFIKKIKDVLTTVISLLTIFLILIFLMKAQTALSEEGANQRNARGDKQTSQIVHFDDNGEIKMLEIDSDGDGVTDQFQWYEDGEVVLMERDYDQDGNIDSSDYFKGGKRYLNKRISPMTKGVEQITTFDPNEQPVEVKRDTVGDALFDTVYRFLDRKLSVMTRDSDGDGSIDIWQQYSDGKLIERHIDKDNNGRWERIICFDENEQPRESRYDPDEDGNINVTGYYREGELWKEVKDSDGNGVYEHVTLYEKGLPVEDNKDMNGDGIFDTLTHFQNGKPARRERDTNYDSKMDLFLYFDGDGLLSKTEEDTDQGGGIDLVRIFEKAIPVKTLIDEDGDKYFETVTVFKDGNISEQLIDKNKDKEPDIKIYFNSRGVKGRVESDTNLDGMIDTWEYYENGIIRLIERDVSGKGRVTSRLLFQNGIRYRFEADKDLDGHFEITQFFDRPPWSIVMEVDVNKDNKPEGRYYYKDDLLRIKEIDEDGDGISDIKEYFNASGKLERGEDENDGKGHFVLEWFYNDKEEAMRAERDTDGDGKTEIWYYYENGRLKSLTEDTNADGRPDIWEEYDNAEALVKRSRDINFDGNPDIVDFESVDNQPLMPKDWHKVK